LLRRVEIWDGYFSVILIETAFGDVKRAPDEHREIRRLPKSRIQIFRMRFRVDCVEIPRFSFQKIRNASFHHKVRWVNFLDKVEISTSPDWNLLLELVADAAEIGIVAELEAARAFLTNALSSCERFSDFVVVSEFAAESQLVAFVVEDLVAVVRRVVVRSFFASATDINSVDVESVAEKLKKSIVAQIGVVSLRAGASRAWRN